MAINIKDEETDRLARELARATGESITVATRTSLEERLARVLAQRSKQRRGPELEELIQRGRSRTLLDARREDEILGYQQDGIPAPPTSSGRSRPKSARRSGR